jgi:small subunit ribosomal protein S5
MDRDKIKVNDTQLNLTTKLVSVQRVTKVTKGGRTFSFSAIVVVGNGNGIVGYGLGKAKDANVAIAKGTGDARKHLIHVPILRDTIPHMQEGHYSGSLVFMKPASPGTGVIAGGAMRAVFETLGVKNVLAKSKGSSNPHSVVKATFDALSRMKDPYKVAQLRGIDLNRVFNG